MKLSDLKYIFKPNFWFLPGKYDSELDEVLRYRMKIRAIPKCLHGGCTLEFEGSKYNLVTIMHYPEYYGVCVDSTGIKRPKRDTTMALKKFIEENKNV